jgi:Carboxypeptidase regulatory-like domain
MRNVAPFFAVLILCFLSTLSSAQTEASLSGVVTDQTGAALRDVAVTIKNVDTGATRTIATDGGGRYEASGLRPGRFEVRAAKQGFADETRTGISLAVGQDATVDIKMQRSTPDACASGHEFATTDCALTWHGITLYGAYDVGAGWVSHGLPVPMDIPSCCLSLRSTPAFMGVRCWSPTVETVSLWKKMARFS